jgi:UDP-N-acetylmuramoyl-L-alanyl-D-glutamate--2,6-diaminopimelate ligase
MQDRADAPCDLLDVIARISPREVRGDPAGMLVREVLFDHRRVSSANTSATQTTGDLFCCLPGEHRDGHDFAAAARQRGAIAFICEHPLGDAAGGAVQLVVGPGQARAAMAHAACARHHDPAAALRTVGVTGTNGKTTTTHLLAGILGANGWPTVVIGTLSGARTTPESPELQQGFADARRLGSAAVAMEVTSHALVQHRVDGYVHDVAVFTNLSRDHLDYHGTMETYFGAKASLFTPEHAKAGVVNGDDTWGARLLEQASVPVEAFSMQQVSGVEIGLGGSRFRLGGQLVELRLAGELNVRNAVAAAAAARALGVGDATIAEGLSSAAPVPGRFEPVDNDLSLGVVVDYAHTPAALAESLAVMRPMVPTGRLIVVFGAGGDRDREKRPEMGLEVSRRADVAVLTSDNPRHEDPDEIIAEVRAGWQGRARLEIEPDRRQAIARALSLAAPGDLVLVAGKGHETTQQLHDDFLPFDDRLVVRQEAARLAGTLPAGVA